MQVGIFGTPSPLTYWTVHAIRIAAQVLYPNYSFIQAVRLDDLDSYRNLIEDRAHENVVLFSDCPDSKICDLIGSIGTPVLFVADEPEDILSFVVTSRDMRIEYALRFLSQSISALSVLFAGENFREIRNHHYSGSVRDYIRSIINFFNFTFTEEQLEQIFFQLFANYEPGADTRVGDQIMRHFAQARWPHRYDVLNAEARDLADRVGAQYGSILRNERYEQIVWPREVFSDWDRPGQFVRGPQAMLGPARFLICGPYLHLPRGLWDARVEIEVDNNLSGNEIRSDVLCGVEVVTGITARLPNRGVFAFDMTFRVSEPLLPVEIRIEMLRGAVEGCFMFRGAKLKRVGSGMPEGRAVEEIVVPPSFVDG